MHQVLKDIINHKHSKLYRPQGSRFLNADPSPTVTQVTQQFTNNLKGEIKLDQEPRRSACLYNNK